MTAQSPSASACSRSRTSAPALPRASLPSASRTTPSRTSRTSAAASTPSRSTSARWRASSSAARSTSLGNRGTLLANLDRLVSLAQREQKLRETGQATMFDLFGAEVATPMPARARGSARRARRGAGLGEGAARRLRLRAPVQGRRRRALAARHRPVRRALGRGSAGAPARTASPWRRSRCRRRAARQPSPAWSATRDASTPRTAGRSSPPRSRTSPAQSRSPSGRSSSSARRTTGWKGTSCSCRSSARERNGRLNISVNEVELFQGVDGVPTGFQPPGLAHEVERQRQWPRQLEARLPTLETERPCARSYQRPQPATSTAPATRDPRPADAPSTLDPRPAAVATATRASLLRIELRETDDEDADRERLAGVLEAIRDFPGDNEVRLTVHTLDGETQRVALSPVRPCDELTARLRDALGEAGEVR